KPGLPLDYTNSSYVFGQLAIDVPAAASEMQVQLSVDRGATIRGTVVGVDGKPPRLIKVLSHQFRARFSDVFYPSTYQPVFDGQLALRGLPSDEERLHWLLDPAGKQGKVLRVRASDVDKPLKVELEKCGSASVRFVDANGTPVAGLALGECAMSINMLPEDAL